MPASLTHFALHVADADSTAYFYRRFGDMQVVRAWENQDGGGLKVAWLKSADVANPFVLVLLEGKSAQFGGDIQAKIGPLSHFGFALDSREAVDAVARKGEAAGFLLMAPRDAGDIVGYHCYLQDPNGHSVEFSFGQALE
jgi:catechol 2,3-dioxygenase-like lactoylglutathione lyase family enzyme